jgi:regulator of protease activity HflC (stomatin/prohibitin superfamily)
MEILLIIIVLCIILFHFSLITVPKDCVYVIERCGKFHRLLRYRKNAYIIIPIADRIAHKIDMKPQFLDWQNSPLITKDNRIVKVSGAAMYQIEDPQLFAYAADNAHFAFEYIIITTLRDWAGRADYTIIPRQVHLCGNQTSNMIDFWRAIEDGAKALGIKPMEVNFIVND